MPLLAIAIAVKSNQWKRNQSKTYERWQNHEKIL